MKNKNWLLLPTVLVLLSGCVGLTFDDIFNPNITQSDEIQEKTQQQADADQKATALPERSETPANVVNSSKRAGEAVTCLDQELSKRFNLPSDFYNIKYYADGSATVRLVNPYTKRQGLFIDVEPRNSGSRLRLYANYTTMSTAWRTLPEKCR